MLHEINWHIGCSGFHYPEWKDVFYPTGLPQSRWFDYYSMRFNTLELNVTFYRFPQLSFAQNWYQKSPSSFSFSVKVPRAITHFKQFNGTERMLGDFYGTVREGLREKLGPILFQLPERAVYSEERLEKLVNSVDPAFTNVIEFRHASWWQQNVYDRLSKHSIIFCSQSHPALPDQVVHNSPTVYYRFHGVPHLYKSQYRKHKIAEVLNEVREPETTRHVYLYFNNTMGIAGIRNARQAEKMVAQFDNG